MIRSSGPTLDALADELATGATTSTALVEACLERIEAKDGEGASTFVRIDAESARRAARGIDELRAAGCSPSPYAGIPLAVKDLFDIAGQTTSAGSRVLAKRPPAARDAPAVARLRRAGFVLIGRTNMTEFAYSGLGINPHFGTPRSIWNRDEGRVPGGSSSGSAIAVADGMAHAALGSDTGGSCRIPAAFNRLVGYKPTACRVPLAGTVPLSTSLDSIGPIARSVACCATLDAILAGTDADALPRTELSGLRLLVPETVALDGLDPHVAAAFERALGCLESAGALIFRKAVPEFAEVASMNAQGGFPAAESHAWHRDLMASDGDSYDPRVRVRIARGATMSAADYINLCRARALFIERLTARLAGIDALVLPTTPILPPRIDELTDDDAYSAANLAALRNPTLINMMDGCAISLPVTGAEEPPVGLMLAAPAGQDRRLLSIAAAVEEKLAGSG